MLQVEQRLQNNREFRRVYAQAKSVVHPLAVIYVLRMPCTDYEPGGPNSSFVRFGFVVSKKQGGAVVRNRIKRRLREAVRLRLPLQQLPFSADVVFVGRKRLLTAEAGEVTSAVDELLLKSGLARN